MLHGTVIHYNQEGGYGFIRADNRNEPDYFFHITELDGTLVNQGHRVVFETAQDTKKLGRMKAVQVKLEERLQEQAVRYGA
jgi:cold shock CspA family protein